MNSISKAVQLTAEQAQQKPVAWQHLKETGYAITSIPQVARIWRDQGMTVEPLYTTPRPASIESSLRKKALVSLEEYEHAPSHVGRERCVIEAVAYLSGLTNAQPAPTWPTSVAAELGVTNLAEAEARQAGYAPLPVQPKE